ncbi:hypothetical protein BJ508DRAFT_322417 [Ascobolus immersus RN42]|uniref:F-box domain-containing protein n=1 Tax=Ascobolus immersus RN42 TaxID=1160509 RepID=A0A3N4II50_ASCIM|nr:hypothetical protein BJ508DRAFT_322417 [Ascobolus immersus RN42]
MHTAESTAQEINVPAMSSTPKQVPQSCTESMDSQRPTPLNLKPVVIKGILSLPPELFSEIFFLLDAFPDVLSLATTCKTAEWQLRCCSYKRAAKTWKAAFQLLEAQRRTPEWKKRKIVEISERRFEGRPQCTFRFLESNEEQPLTPEPTMCISQPDIMQLRFNHGLVGGWVRKHAEFLSRGIMWRRTLFGIKIDEIDEEAADDERSIPITRSEEARMMDTIYTMIWLQTRIFVYTLLPGQEPQSDTNYAPLFDLTLRECFEIIVLLRVLFMESAIAEPHYISSRFRSPLFSTKHLRVALTVVVNHKLQWLAELVDGRRVGLVRCRRPDPYRVPNTFKKSFDLLASRHHIMRSIFFDENQELLEEFFVDLEAEVLEEYSDPEDDWVDAYPCKRFATGALLGFTIPSAMDKVEAWSYIKEVSDEMQPYPFSGKVLTIRKLSKDGVVTLDNSEDCELYQQGPYDLGRFKNCLDENAEWGIFLRSNMYQLRERSTDREQWRREVAAN